MMKFPGQLVFGLDIGTRSIVGTVGYRTGERFHVVAQCVREHETRWPLRRRSTGSGPCWTVRFMTFIKWVRPLMK